MRPLTKLATAGALAGLLLQAAPAQTSAGATNATNATNATRGAPFEDTVADSVAPVAEIALAAPVLAVGAAAEGGGVEQVAVVKAMLCP